MARFVGTVVKQRSVLWGALAALVLGAGALVVALGGGGGDGSGDGSPPRLPLAAGGNGAGVPEAAADATSLRLAVVYVPGDDLPELGGEAPAYRLAGEVTADDVGDLAEALGIEAEPTETDTGIPGEDGGSWHADDGEMALDVDGPDGTWSAYRMVGDPVANPAARDAAAATEAEATSTGGGSAGTPTPQNLVGQTTCPGSAPGADNVVSLCEPPLCPTDADTPTSCLPPCPTGPAADPPPDCPPICLDAPDVATDAPRCEPPVCPEIALGPDGPAIPPDNSCVPPPCPGDPTSDTRCVPTTTLPPGDPGPVEPRPTPDPTVPPTTVPPPADLPSEDEAREAALDLLAATGADVDGAEVTAENLVSMWSITAEPQVDGRPAPGLAMYVGIGDDGRIESASGGLATPDELGDYPLIDTRDALTRLNEGWGFAGVAASSSGVAVDLPAEVPADAAAEEGDGIAGSVPPETASAPGGGPVMTIEPPGGPDTPVSNEPAVDPAPTVEPVEPVEPTEVEVTDAEIVLVNVASWDGSGTYLVPGYRFTAADGSQPTVPAVTDDVLEPPAGEPEPAPVPPVAGEATEPGDPGSAGGGTSAGGGF
jgi:hypothetical protein